jgi:hypothetical protein
MATSRIRTNAVLIVVIAAALVCSAQDSGRSLTIVYRDGHQKTLTMSDGSRIEFNGASMVVRHGRDLETIPVSDVERINFGAGNQLFGRNHFVGKWEFGTGVGSQTFFVTLDRDGQAHKTIGSRHGTWTVVGGEARIKWDDGWTDILRKVGDKHQKFAYEPGRSLSEDPSNVTDAKTRNAEPI